MLVKQRIVGLLKKNSDSSVITDDLYSIPTPCHTKMWVQID